MKKNLIINLALLFSTFVFSYYTAPYFGALYDKFSPQYDGTMIGLPKSFAVFIAGLPVAYVFFIPFLFEMFGSGSRRKWMAWLLVPPALFWIAADKYYIYVPAILGIIGFALAWIIRIIISKIKRPNHS